MVWNPNNRIECKKLKNVDKKQLGKKGAIIEFSFYPSKNMMEFFFKEINIATLTNIVLFNSDYFTPCIVFLQNCSIEMEFEYPN